MPPALYGPSNYPAGSGHRYWKRFSSDAQTQIETRCKDIYKALYHPHTGMPLTTLDVPVAGRGDNTLPFVFDLVNLSNNVRLRTAQSKPKENSRLMPTGQ